MDYSRQEIYWIWLSSVEGIGVGRFNKLVEIYGSPDNVLKNAGSRLHELSFIDAKTAKALAESSNDGYIDSFMSSLDKKGLFAVCQTSEYYPDMLKAIYNPPLVLYCHGNIEALVHDKKIAVVGTRRPTRYGRDATLDICRNLAQSGICVVSGMARGIDSYSHLGALDAGGCTIAVLGCGTDVIYPPENDVLYKRITEQGIIVSEYVPGTEPLSSHFPSRNRIISGMSNGVLVVEASRKSGTLITIEYAQDQGRDVLAVPGNISSAMSDTPNSLIKEGCIPVTSHEDVLSWFGWSGRAGLDESRIKQLDINELSIINILERGETVFDEIYLNLDYSRPQLMTMLLNLELKGIIEKLPGNKYGIKRV